MTMDTVGKLARIMNKGPGGAETFDQTTDSLEAIRDFIALSSSGLVFYGVVTGVPGANQFTIPTLAGLGAGKFAGTNPWNALVFRDAGGLSAAPQGGIQPITAYVDATGVFTTNPYTVAVGIGDEILLINPAFEPILDLVVPIVGSAVNALERDVIGNKGDQANFNTDSASIVYSLMSWLRGIARAKIVLVGNAEAGSTASNIISVASLNQVAGYWKGQRVQIMDGVNVRLVRPITSYNAGTNTITVSPAFPAAIAAGVTFIILDDYQDPLATADAATNLTPADVIGNKADAAVTTLGVVASIMAYTKGILLGIAAASHGFQEQASVAVNITAILASETNVLNLATAATRYQVRSLRLKCADPGANTVTVRLYSLVNAVSTVVATFTITGTNFGSYHSLMDMFGVPYLADDNIKITVQATAAGPFAVTGQYSYATAT